MSENHRPFVDHHAHFLTAAARYEWPAGNAWFPELAARDSNPMDEPWPTGTNNPTGNKLIEAIHTSLHEVASLGISAFVEAGVPDASVLHALHALRARESLPVQVEVLLGSGFAESIGPAAAADLRTGDAQFDVTGVKFYADGWTSFRSCAVTSEFDHLADNGGILFLDRDTLARRIAPFASTGLRIATHAIGDRALDHVLDAYELVYGSDCSRRAPRVEHLTVTRPDQHARMGEMGIVACIQPSFADMDAATGQHLHDGLHDWTGLLAASVRVVAGSDAPIGPASPHRGLDDLLRTHPEIGAERALALLTTPLRTFG